MKLLVAFVVVLLIVLHFTLHIGFSLAGGAPDLLTIAVLIAARGTSAPRAALLGAALGLLEDAMSILSFGANALSLAIVGTLGARTRDLFVGDSIFFGVSYLVLGKWLRDLIHWLAVGPQIREPFLEAMIIESGIASLYVAVVGLLLLWVTGLTWDPGTGGNSR